MNLKVTLSAAALVLLFGVASAPQPAKAQISQQGAGYLLRIKWVQGAIYKYDVVTKVSVGSKGAKPIEQHSPYVMKVLGVKNGIATLQVKADVSGLVGGKGQTINNTLKVDSRGKILEGDKSSVGFFELPEKAVKLNSPWSSNQSAQTPIGKMAIKATYKLTGTKTVNGKKFLIVSTNTTGSSSTMTTSGGGTMLIDMKDGMMYSMDSVQNMSIKGTGSTSGSSAPQTLPVSVSVKRLP